MVKYIRNKLVLFLKLIHLQISIISKCLAASFLSLQNRLTLVNFSFIEHQGTGRKKY
jgi:hypothetical protein